MFPSQFLTIDFLNWKRIETVLSLKWIWNGRKWNISWLHKSCSWTKKSKTGQTWRWNWSKRNSSHSKHPYWQILENSSKFLFEISIFRVLTQAYYWKTHPVWIVDWMSIPEIGLYHAQKFWNRRLDEFSRNLSWSNFGDNNELKFRIENFEFFDIKNFLELFENP